MKAFAVTRGVHRRAVAEAWRSARCGRPCVTVGCFLAELFAAAVRCEGGGGWWRAAGRTWMKTQLMFFFQCTLVTRIFHEASRVQVINFATMARRRPSDWLSPTAVLAPVPIISLWWWIKCGDRVRSPLFAALPGYVKYSDAFGLRPWRVCSRRGVIGHWLPRWSRRSSCCLVFVTSPHSGSPHIGALAVCYITPLWVAPCRHWAACCLLHRPTLGRRPLSALGRLLFVTSPHSGSPHIGALAVCYITPLWVAPCRHWAACCLLHRPTLGRRPLSALGRLLFVTSPHSGSPHIGALAVCYITPLWVAPCRHWAACCLLHRPTLGRRPLSALGRLLFVTSPHSGSPHIGALAVCYITPLWVAPCRHWAACCLLHRPTLGRRPLSALGHLLFVTSPHSGSPPVGAGALAVCYVAPLWVAPCRRWGACCLLRRPTLGRPTLGRSLFVTSPHSGSPPVDAGALAVCYVTPFWVAPCWCWGACCLLRHPVLGRPLSVLGRLLLRRPTLGRPTLALGRLLLRRPALGRLLLRRPTLGRPLSALGRLLLRRPALVPLLFVELVDIFRLPSGRASRCVHCAWRGFPAPAAGRTTPTAGTPAPPSLHQRTPLLPTPRSPTRNFIDPSSGVVDLRFFSARSRRRRGVCVFSVLCACGWAARLRGVRRSVVECGCSERETHRSHRLRRRTVARTHTSLMIRRTMRLDTLADLQAILHRSACRYRARTCLTYANNLRVAICPRQQEDRFCTASWRIWAVCYCYSSVLHTTMGGTIHRCIDISWYLSRDTYRDILFFIITIFYFLCTMIFI